MIDIAECLRQFKFSLEKGKTKQERGLEKHLQKKADAYQRRKREYEKYLKSDIWAGIRHRKLEQAGAICAICGSRENITVHHTKYPKKLGTERMGDLVVLCWGCHKKQHIRTEA